LDIFRLAIVYPYSVFYLTFIILLTNILLDRVYLSRFKV